MKIFSSREVGVSCVSSDHDTTKTRKRRITSAKSSKNNKDIVPQIEPADNVTKGEGVGGKQAWPE